MHMHKNPLTLLVTIAALSLTAPAAAETFSLDLEAGYQWVSVNGNEDMYRTQVNQDDGFVLRGLHVNLIDPASDGIIDRLVVDAAGFGGEPSGRFRLEAGLGKIYRLRLNYRSAEMYSALPALANPFADDGIVPGQHTFDRDRTMLDVEFELFPGKAISGIFGYRFNEIDGPRRTTYHMGQDEFQLSSDLEETEDEFYLGASFAFGDWAGSLIQGWRNFESTETMHLVPGAEGGNYPGTVLGLDIHADDFNRTTSTEADTPVTTFHIAGHVKDNVAVRASYIRADADSETQSDEMASGSLASFRVSRFFQGLDESVASATESPSWRGDLEFSIGFTDSFTADLAFGKRKRTQDGWAMISTLYSDTMTFGGLSSDDVLRLVEVENANQRDDESIDLRFNLSPDGPLDFWAGAGLVATDFALSPDAAQIAVPVAQDGSFKRTVNTYVLGGAVKAGDGRVSLEIESQQADDPIMRTDLTNRLNMRMRIQLPISDMFDLNAIAELSDGDNYDSGVGYEATSRRYGIDIGFTPTEYATFHLTWDDLQTDSSMDIREPQSFDVVESLYTEDATVLDGWVDIHLDRVGFNLGYSVFANDGSFELKLDRAFARVNVVLCDHASAILEYETYDYSEDLFTAADFDSDRIGLFIRMTY